MARSQLLKKDLFGEIRLFPDGEPARILRDTVPAARATRWLARRLLAREARALAAADGLPGIPEVLQVTRDRMERSYLAGEPMHRARPTDAAYFRALLGLVRRLHAGNIVHNDLAKEPNLLVLADGSPGIVDFQLAWHARKRNRLFRALAHEDLRHVLKHKRSYRPDLLTRRERNILANPGLVARAWRRIVKPPYLFVTRRLFGWADREGAGDRGERR